LVGTRARYREAGSGVTHAVAAIAHGGDFHAVDERPVLCNSQSLAFRTTLVTSTNDAAVVRVTASPRLPPLAFALAALACTLLALLAYGPSLPGAGFLNFDDNLYFGPDNELFRAANDAARERGVLAGLWAVVGPGAVVADVYLPVAHASLWLDGWWFDGRPFGPHLVAVLLHACAGVLLLRWLLAMRLPVVVAGATAGAFVVHPALCESVAWVSGRKDLLCGVFVFAALWRTSCFVTTGRRMELVAMFVLAVLAMYSKATAVVLPLVAGLTVLWLHGDRRAYLAPLVLLLATLPIALHHQSNAALAGTMIGGGAIDRLPQVPGALLHYAMTAAWPTHLNVLYPEVATLERFRLGAFAASGALGVLLLVALMCCCHRRLRWTGIGLAGFFVALLPFNTAFPASVIGVADRYLYLAVPWLAVALFSLVPQRGRWPCVVGVAVVFVLLVATWQRAPTFGSSEQLWCDSLEQDPVNAVALLNLIQATSRRHEGASVVDLAATKELAERAVAAARYPEHERRAQLLLLQFALAENRLEAASLACRRALAATERIADSGRVSRPVAEQLLVETLLSSITPLRLAGEGEAAVRALERAKSLRPSDARIAAAEVLLAVEALVASTGGAAVAPADPRLTAIERQIEAARKDKAEDAQLEYAAGVFARLKGQSLKAIACFRRAAGRSPELAEAWVGAAEVCLDGAMAAEAEEYARGGISIAVQLGRAADPRLRLCLARALQGQGRLDEAIGSLQDYVNQTGLRDRDAARLLSGLLMHKARQRLSAPDVTHTELQGMIERALRVNPQEPAVDLVRARILRDQRRFASAIEALERLQRAMPDLEDTAEMLAENLRDLGYQRLIAKDDAAAADAWLRCVALNVPEVPLDAVKLQLAAIWRRQEQAGIAARQNGDESGARAAFRLCLRIAPDQWWAAWLLVLGLVEDPAADVHELEQRSQQAIDWQVQHQLERSRQVIVRAMVLRRLQRQEEARTLLDDYLAAPDAETSAEMLQALRSLRRELDP
jgi:tetratricopeptide (TPR) repeat protein